MFRKHLAYDKPQQELAVITACLERSFVYQIALLFSLGLETSMSKDVYTCTHVLTYTHMFMHGMHPYNASMHTPKYTRVHAW